MRELVLWQVGSPARVRRETEGVPRRNSAGSVELVQRLIATGGVDHFFHFVGSDFRHGGFKSGAQLLLSLGKRNGAGRFLEGRIEAIRAGEGKNEKIGIGDEDALRSGTVQQNQVCGAGLQRDDQSGNILQRKKFFDFGKPVDLGGVPKRVRMEVARAPFRS